MPLQLKLASALFIFNAALAACLGIVVIAMTHLSLPFLLIIFAIDAFLLWLGITLWRHPQRVLGMARVIGILALVGSLSQVLNRQSIIGQPSTSAVRVLTLVIDVVIVASLFWPGMDKALKDRSSQTSA